MRLTWFRLVSTSLVLAAAFVLGSASLTFAQAAQTPQQPAAAAQPPAAEKKTLEFKNDAGLIILYIKADKTADFEDLMNKYKEALGKVDAPEAKQQAASLKLFKVPNVQGGIAVYVLFADPAVKNAEYWFLPTMYKVFPAEAQALFQKWSDAKAATPPPSIFDLQQVLKLQ
ncbi:MAG TPA: hypothetical protein VGK32_21255 [Vicinamibacterales bacterium]|jgi:hypothetical protein